MRRLSSSVLVVAAGAALLAVPSAVAATAPAAAEPPAGYRTVVDDTGVVSVALPEAWGADTAPVERSTLEDEWYAPAISAGPALEAPACEQCRPYFPAPTVDIVVSPYEPIAPTADPDCEAPEVVPFESHGFSGRRENGGGCDADIERVIASKPGAITVDLTFVYWSADQPLQSDVDRAAAAQIFETILATFDWTGVPYVQGSISAPASDLPPATLADGADFTGLWPYASFTDVPQFGTEPVRGSGCGSTGDLGETIPDGLWAGYVFPGEGGVTGVDLVCVYFGDSAQAVLADGTSTVIDASDPDFLLVSNSDRQRAVPPSSDDTVVLWGVDDGRGACTPQAAMWTGPGGLTSDLLRYDGSLAWVRIDGGVLTWVFYGCDTGFTPGG